MSLANSAIVKRKVMYETVKKPGKICTTFAYTPPCSHYKLIDEGRAFLSCNSVTST
jgi:hypothetical protein